MILPIYLTILGLGVILFIASHLRFFAYRSGWTMSLAAGLLLLVSGIFLVGDATSITYLRGINVTTNYTFSSGIPVSSMDKVVYDYTSIDTRLDKIFQWIMLASGFSISLYTLFYYKKKGA